MKKHNYKYKGILVSLEMIMILAGVIVLAFVAMNGVGRMILSQATASKATVTITDAQAYYYGSSRSASSNSFIMASLYVTNIGDSDIRVTKVTVYTNDPYHCHYDSPGLSVIVHPGETVPISVKLSRNSDSCSATLPDTSIVSVTYSVGGRSNSVSNQIFISSP